MTSPATASPLAPIAFGGLLAVFCAWWMYFAQPAEKAVDFARGVFLSSPKYAFVWGYFHYFVFAAIAANTK